MISATASETVASRGQDEILTADEVIALLKLDEGSTYPRERLRNLERRHGLPVKKRGGIKRYRRSEILAWLDRGHRGYRSRSKGGTST